MYSGLYPNGWSLGADISLSTTDNGQAYQRPDM